MGNELSCRTTIQSDLRERALPNRIARPLVTCSLPDCQMRGGMTPRSDGARGDRATGSAFASALLRGLTLDSGRFRTCAPSRQRMWLEGSGLDVLLFSGALFVYLRSVTGPFRACIAKRPWIKA
jgi:hypothetical protein